MSEPAVGEAVVPLLKGVVYSDTQPRAWETLLAIPAAVRDYLTTLGLEVIIDEAEGYAFLRQREEEPTDLSVPRLVARRPLSFRVTLLLALLRRQLLELDTSGDQTRLVLTRDQIVELVRTYHPERRNEAKLADAVESDVRRVIDLGMMRALRDQPHTYEVRRILKAFVDAQWLGEVSAHLASLVGEESDDAEPALAPGADAGTAATGDAAVESGLESGGTP
ncbi:MAG: DUF4194 domain-containing protein [Actinobacteria bacterium]|nr:DUF4194 domain-containing protein [Actinomycetota bacterium]